MRALPIKKQIEVLKLALEIYNDVERLESISIFGKHTGLCICIKHALTECANQKAPFQMLSKLIPRFNFDALYSKGLAGIIPKMQKDACADGFWWDEYDRTIRPIVLQYLIDSYKK